MEFKKGGIDFSNKLVIQCRYFEGTNTLPQGIGHFNFFILGSGVFGFPNQKGAYYGFNFKQGTPGTTG